MKKQTKNQRQQNFIQTENKTVMLLKGELHSNLPIYRIKTRRGVKKQQFALLATRWG